MRYLQNIFLIIITIVLIGCTTYSNNHYSLMPEPKKVELEFVTKQINDSISPIMSKFGLSDAMASYMPETVLLYYSSGGDSALRVGVRIDKGKVVIDTFQYRSGTGNSPEYLELEII